MITSLTILFISYILMGILIWKKSIYTFNERYIIIPTILFTILSISIIVLLFYNFRFYGQYTNSIIGQTTLSLIIILFGITKIRFVKILTGIISIPLLIIGLIGIVFQNIALFILIIPYLIFCPPKENVKADEIYSIERKEGGMFGGCPSNIYLVENIFPFEKAIKQNIQCTGKIESIKIEKYIKDKSIIFSTTGSEYNLSKVYKIDTVNINLP